ncbi:BgTH12-00767 [Blumeria graminis f. sp. triticale]|uniref:BgTH12-00767 n=1 Tax=Blumeria graminis f. sp. triticale TaxID=1689686 RepID=A0A9W4DCE6_BLUGR|nr:BgTH12-00767 [Blumeria graminis f. sp. triticale]
MRYLRYKRNWSKPFSLSLPCLFLSTPTISPCRKFFFLFEPSRDAFFSLANLPGLNDSSAFKDKHCH